MPLSCIKDLIQNQRFDLTTLNKEIDEPRDVGGGRQVSNVVLIDEADDDGKIPKLKLGTFHGAPLSSDESAMMNILRDGITNKEAISFLHCKAKKQTEVIR